MSKVQRRPLGSRVTLRPCSIAPERTRRRDRMVRNIRSRLANNGESAATVGQFHNSGRKV